MESCCDGDQLPARFFYGYTSGSAARRSSERSLAHFGPTSLASSGPSPSIEAIEVATLAEDVISMTRQNHT